MAPLMRFNYICLFVGLCTFTSLQSKAQQYDGKATRASMIRFLIHQKQLTNIQDTIQPNLDVIYDRAIFQGMGRAKIWTIYLFGSNSPHGKRFIALVDQTGIILLETKDLPIDLPVIVSFLARNSAISKQAYKCLNVIAETYQYNSKRNFRPVLEEK